MFSTCAAKLRSGRSARPLTKYASTPPTSVTAAVMYQFVTPKAACAPLMMIVSSSSGRLLCGSKASGAPDSISLYAEMPLPIASIYRLPE